MENEELKSLAAQLRFPQGSRGIQISDMMHESNANMIRKTIESLHVSYNEEVFELGHGNAGHLHYLFDIEKSSLYYGLEISELMHAEAKQINKSFVDEKQAFFFMYDGAEMPFGDDYFDKGYTVNTIYFWNEPVKVLMEIYRVMKPAGVFSITFAQRKSMELLPFTKFGFELYDMARAEKLIRQTPFEIVHTENHVEVLKAKSGESIQREFTIIRLKK
jgi:SAM-dependent methyltransferase